MLEGGDSQTAPFNLHLRPLTNRNLLTTHPGMSPKLDSRKCPEMYPKLDSRKQTDVSF